MSFARCTLVLPFILVGTNLFPGEFLSSKAETSGVEHPLTIRADTQEYDAKTQIVTARGNVQMVYPARQIQATSAQAQYFTKERRIDLIGQVYILQKGGNSIRAEKVTYLIDEGRFIALPQPAHQVQSVYMVEDNPDAATAKPAPKTPDLKRSK